MRFRVKPPFSNSPDVVLIGPESAINKAVFSLNLKPSIQKLSTVTLSSVLLF